MRSPPFALLLSLFLMLITVMSSDAKVLSVYLRSLFACVGTQYKAVWHSRFPSFPGRVSRTERMTRIYYHEASVFTAALLFP